MKMMNKFHVIVGGRPSYHVLLRRPWIHQHKSISSTYHQHVKVHWKRKKNHICASDSPIQKNEVHLNEAVFFDKLAGYGEATPSKSQSIRPPTWKRSKERRPRSNALAPASIPPPQPRRHQNQTDRKRPFPEESWGKVRLPDGRVTYIL